LKRSWIQDVFLVRVLHGNRTSVLSWAGILIAVIAVADWHFENDISFGFLYLFPMLMVGGCLARWQIAGVAALCTALTEAFDPFPWTTQVGISRLILTFAAFFGAGFFGFTSARSRTLASRHLEEVEREIELRRTTEEQLEFLISSSPATIFTLDGDSRVLLANEAAHKLLRVEKGSLQGRPIAQFFPALATVPPSLDETPTFRTDMECRGRREDDEVFLAHVWFSTYRTKSGPRLAAVVFDSSEELRDRVEFNMQQILTGSKMLVGALCHEIRNVCGAIAVVHSKLSRDKNMTLSEDFRALGTLVQGLEKMAGLELRQTTQSVAENIDVRSVLDELRIVIEPSFQESGMSTRWEAHGSLPRVWADHEALLQAFLNIARNSQRAMEGHGQPDARQLIVRSSLDEHSVTVRFIDAGPGVDNPDLLFQPFQPGAQASGLGLYLSRTFVRAFQGDIEYEAQPAGCCFAVSLALASDHQAGSAGSA